MTCWIGECSRGRRGTTLVAAVARSSSRRSKPSFWLTCRVQRASWSSRTGSPIRDSVPTIIDPTYWSGAVNVLYGLGWFGPSFGPAPSPLALLTSSCPSTMDNEVGYHPVGIRPLLRPVRVATTATSLLPELAT